MGEDLSLVIDKYFKKQSRDEAISLVFELDGVAVLVYRCGGAECRHHFLC